MAKKLLTVVKIQIPAGKANPAPPVGTALGPHGLNIQDFCAKFNAATQDKLGNIIPVEVSVYADRTFDFKLKTPPASDLLRKAARIEKGSGDTPRTKAGNVTKAQIRQIAEQKLTDLNANNVDAAAKIIEGTARSMGIIVE
ncbi:MAG: 50S ribosomal protein L11 [Candidatus Spechtbacteria bacterium]|nr:50S ribosomal protein L11 [Candidatus Spechtbacteria bacterium]